MSGRSRVGGVGAAPWLRQWLVVSVVVLLVANGSLVVLRTPRVVAVALDSPEVAEPTAPPAHELDTAAAAQPVPTAAPPPFGEPAAPGPTAGASSSAAPTAPAAPTPTPTPTPTSTPTAIATAITSQRTVASTGWQPFAVVEGVVLHHPADQVERIGFHQSNHEGARDMTVYDTAAAPLVLESRGRLSGAQSAADVVIDPTEQVRAPVSGTVVRASAYTLYCDQTDEFLVIAPDAQPSWEVKVLHVVGLQVAAGDRVEAGVTVVAERGHPLPFRSQVDEVTAEPSWPHTHIEVVDPSIPNQPNGGSGYEDCP